MISNLMAVPNPSVAPEAARNEAARNVAGSDNDRAADDAFAMLVGPQADHEQAPDRQSGEDQPDHAKRLVQDPADGSPPVPLGTGQNAPDRANTAPRDVTPSGVVPKDQGDPQSRKLPDVSAGQADLTGQPTAQGRAAPTQGQFAEHITDVTDTPRSPRPVKDTTPRQGSPVGAAPSTASAHALKNSGDIPGQVPAALSASSYATAVQEVPSNAGQSAGPDAHPIPADRHARLTSASPHSGVQAQPHSGLRTGVGVVQSRSILGVAHEASVPLPEDHIAHSIQHQVAGPDGQTPSAQTMGSEQLKRPPQPAIMPAHSNTSLGSGLPLGEAAMKMMEDTAIAAETGADPAIAGPSAASSAGGTAFAQVGLPRAMAPPVAAQIAQAAAAGSGEGTQITLNPEELGRVRISMSSGESGLVVTILAERPETADLMRRNIDLLLREFAELGYQSPAFEFQNGDADSNREKPTQNRAVGPLVSENTDTPSTLASPAARTPSGGLDLIL